LKWSSLELWNNRGDSNLENFARLPRYGREVYGSDKRVRTSLSARMSQKPFHTRPNFTKFSVYYLWLWLCPRLPAMQYVMYCRFCGWMTSRLPPQWAIWRVAIFKVTHQGAAPCNLIECLLLWGKDIQSALRRFSFWECSLVLKFLCTHCQAYIQKSSDLDLNLVVQVCQVYTVSLSSRTGEISE